jgi:hypothetical protein
VAIGGNRQRDQEPKTGGHTHCEHGATAFRPPKLVRRKGLIATFLNLSLHVATCNAGQFPA